MMTLRLKTKTKNVYECFSQRDQNSIQQALNILKVREKEEEKEEQNKIFPDDTTREQVVKNKNIFLLGLTTRSIKLKELRLKTNQANTWKTLHRFQNQINTLDQSSSSKFQSKMQIVDKTMTDCTSTVHQTYEVLKNVRQRGDNLVFRLFVYYGRVYSKSINLDDDDYLEIGSRLINLFEFYDIIWHLL